MNQSRMTVVEQVYFQQSDSQPLTFDSKFSANLSSDDQPYIRQTTVGAEWAPLDYGWLPDGGMLLLTNDEGRRGRQNLSEEVTGLLSLKVVELSFGIGSIPHILIPHKCSVRLFPASVKDVNLRCRGGSCRIVVQLFPR